MFTTKRILSIIFLFLLLALVRFFEHSLFYDPLADFYKGNYLKKIKPDFNYWLLLGSTSLRFLLNTAISLLVIWVASRKVSTFKFSLFFYVTAYLILILFFAYLTYFMHSNQYFLLFYVRRFLIQPIFVILLLPAFYYQSKVKKEEN